MGWNWLAKHRRTLGLFAFSYGVLHWLVYILLDIQLDLDEMVTDIIKRPYILIGSFALLCLLPALACRAEVNSSPQLLVVTTSGRAVVVRKPYEFVAD